MPDIYFDPIKVIQYTDGLQAQLRHIRQLQELIRRCQANDSQHQPELERIQQRLEKLEWYLVQMLAAMQEAVDHYRRLCSGAEAELEDARSRVESLFN